MSDRILERTLARLAKARRNAQPPPSAQQTLRQAQGRQFRAVVEERLRNLERQLDEVKGRVNGLLFLLAGAVATEVVLRLVR